MRLLRSSKQRLHSAIIDTSKGYIHRAAEDEPWALRGLEHPAFGEPVFAAFQGSEEFLAFCDGWCTGGLKPEDIVVNKKGKCVSRKRSELAKERLEWKT